MTGTTMTTPLMLDAKVFRRLLVSADISAEQALIENPRTAEECERNAKNKAVLAMCAEIHRAMPAIRGMDDEELRIVFTNF